MANHFKVGPQVQGEDFFGRRRELRELDESVFDGVGAISLVGPARVGKSSLLDQLFLERDRGEGRRLTARLNMAEFSDSRGFWRGFADSVWESARRTSLWGADFERYYARCEGVDMNSARWFEQLKTPLGYALSCMGRQGWRLVLCIDEFDAVYKVFGDESCHYQFLRSVYSEPRYATSGVVISRRRLSQFESVCPHIFTLHRVFREMFLTPFGNVDEDAFYDALGRHGVSISAEGQRRLTYYTGGLPYLCCLFARCMVERRQRGQSFTGAQIDQIHAENLPQIDQYYDDLIQGIREDGWHELLFDLSMGVKPPFATERYCGSLEAMGILNRDEGSYYAFSRDFMEYFRAMPLKLPAWDTISGAEKKLKKIFGLEYAGLGAVNYQDLNGPNGDDIRRDVILRYPDLKLDWNMMNTYCRDLSFHKAEPTLLDVLTLGKVISVMLETWESKFRKYFDGNDTWRDRLALIKKLRNPIAHGQIEYVDDDELSECLHCCGKLIQLDWV